MQDGEAVLFVAGTSDESYRLLVETIEDYAICMLDVHGHVATWNAGAERAKGYLAHEIIGTHFSIFYPREDVSAGKPERALQVVRERGRIEVEGWRLRKDGSRFWANVVITALRDKAGTLTGFGKVTRDLTRRRLAEEELRLSEERFRLLVESVGDYAIYMLDPTGRVSTWNAGAEQIKGFTAQEIIGAHFSVFFTEEAARRGDPSRELMVAATEGRFEEEAWRVRKDGSQFWANVVLTAIHSAHGELLGFAKVTRDLTIRRATEATERELMAQQVARAVAEAGETKLREEGERYRALSRRLEAVLEGVADGITVQDRFGKLLFANSAAARSCGFDSVAELLAATTVEIVKRFVILDAEGKPLDVERFPGRIALNTGEHASALMRVRALPSEAEAWQLVRSSPVLGADGSIDLAVNIWHDVSDERRREQHESVLFSTTAALSSSLDERAMVDTLAELLVHGLADWCAIHTLDGDVLKNVAVAHADPDLAERAREHQRRFPPDPKSKHGVWAVIQTRKSQCYASISDEFLVDVARDAAHLERLRALAPRSALIVPIVARERVLGALSLVSTQATRRYDRNDVALAEEIGRRTGVMIENARLFDAEKEASRIKDEFLATVSHELRTPMNAIVGWSSLLRSGASTADMVKGVEVIHRNALAQAKIIEDILDVSRIVAGKLRLDLTSSDLAVTIRNAIEVVAPSATAKGIAIDFVPPSEPCMLVVDHDRLQQVVWNLLSNAVKFTERGGRVAVTIDREGSKCEVTVIDTGRGIDADFLPYVFDRFKQADSSTVRKFGGLGLGLAIVRHIVELHGGRVFAHSAGRKAGATFTVQLPIQAVMQTREREPITSRIEPIPSKRKAPSLQGVRVVVVDDEADARELLTAVLVSAGAHVDVATSASEGFALITHVKPHVLVSDIGMPSEDGYALMQRLRALDEPALAKLPAIALTAYTRGADRTKALAAGFNTHVGKPVNPDDLIAAVANLGQPHVRKS